MSTTEPSAAMTFTLDDDDTCADCGQEFELCRCNNGLDGCSPDSWDYDYPDREPMPDEHTVMLDGAIYLAEQARDVLALKSLIAQRDGKPLHEVWIHLEPLRTRKHRLRWRRRTKARERRGLERGRRAAHRAGLDVGAVEVATGWTCPADITAMCHAFVVWTDGGMRVDQVLDGYATTGDDLPY